MPQHWPEAAGRQVVGPAGPLLGHGLCAPGCPVPSALRVWGKLHLAQGSSSRGQSPPPPSAGCSWLEESPEQAQLSWVLRGAAAHRGRPGDTPAPSSLLRAPPPPRVSPHLLLSGGRGEASPTWGGAPASCGLPPMAQVCPLLLPQFHAMDTLHRSVYDVAKAISALVPQGGPVLCRDEMEEWSASEASLFEEALEKYGKDFTDIQQDFVSTAGGLDPATPPGAPCFCPLIRQVCPLSRWWLQRWGLALSTPCCFGLGGGF